MMNSSVKSLSKCFFSRIQCRTLSSQINAKINKQVNINNGCNGYYLTYNYCTNGLEGRKSFLGNSRPILTNLGHTNWRNLGVRNFSIVSSTFETLHTVAKYLEDTPVEWLQNVILWTHSTTGLPWWATIIINAAVIRICLIVPLNMYQRGELLRWRTNVIAEMAKNDNYRKFNEELAKSYTDRYRKHKRRIVFGNFPIIFCQLYAIYNLCEMLPVASASTQLTQMELSVGGFGWIKDLTRTDSYYILPSYMGLLSFIKMQINLNINVFSKNRKLSSDEVQTVKQLMIVPMFVLVLASYAPAAVLLGWGTHSTLKFVEMLVLSSPKVYRIMGIAPSESEQLLYENMKKKYDYKLP